MRAAISTEVIENKLYRVPVSSGWEAEYLVAILNAPALDVAFRQCRNTDRHFDKLPLTRVPIPQFDQFNADHASIVALSAAIQMRRVEQPDAPYPDAFRSELNALDEIVRRLFPDFCIETEDPRMTNRHDFAERIRSGQTTFAPVCLDPLTGRLIESLGFDAAYLSGGGFGFQLAVSEALLTTTEIATLTRQITARSGVPLIVDGGVGFGDAVHLTRAIREIESAGGAAIEIEDQVSPSGRTTTRASSSWSRWR